MTGRLYEQLCRPDHLYEAWKRVARKRGVAGADGETVDDFADRFETGIMEISRSLTQLRYHLSPLKEVYIPKNNCSFRRLCIPTVRDRIVFQAANRLILAAWEPIFSPLSFAYRIGLGRCHAASAAWKMIREGKWAFIKGDIQCCFDDIDHDILGGLVSNCLREKLMCELLLKSVRVPVISKIGLFHREKGVPQGSPISPSLVNLYLSPFDSVMSSSGFPVIRYADDWLVLCKTEQEAEQAYIIAEQILQLLNLSINLEKSILGNLRHAPITFLGYQISYNAIEDLKQGCSVSYFAD